MHCVSCMLSLSCFLQKEEREWRTAQRKTSLSVLSNPILALRQHEHEQALSFLTCEERRRVNWGTGKATQRVNASIRHVHREHSAYSNPTCALVFVLGLILIILVEILYFDLSPSNVCEALKNNNQN